MHKLNVLSVIESVGSSDGFLQRLCGDLDKLRLIDRTDVINSQKPSRHIVSGPMLASNLRAQTPPHISVLAQVVSAQQTFGMAEHLAKLVRMAGSHLLRRQRQARQADIIGTNVFIGHGSSPMWRALKDFIEDRLNLPVDEFNRLPVAGVTNIARLSEMMDAAAIALLVMTGEDEQPDGRLHARMNVIHEAGLFQGRLGFTRAIVLLEQSCEEFSNIEGLGQIRFPRGNMKAAFEDIREVFEREGIFRAVEEVTLADAGPP